MTYDPRDSQHGVPLFIPLVASGVTGFMLVRMTYDPRPDSQVGVPLFIPLVASGVAGFMLVVSLIFVLPLH